MIDEFLAKSGVSNCANFRETGDVISKVAFKMFLGVVFETTNWNNEGTAFSLVFTENPLTDFVELPPQYKELTYCNVLVGKEIIKLSFVFDIIIININRSYQRCIRNDAVKG